MGYDLPVVLSRSHQRTIDAASLRDPHMATASSNFSAVPLPSTDVVTMGMILHD